MLKRLWVRTPSPPIAAEATVESPPSVDPEPSVPRGIVGDSPIRSPDQDSFGIDPFARAIAGSIQEADTRDGLVYAVNGVWGSGKSSAVNLRSCITSPRLLNLGPS